LHELIESEELHEGTVEPRKIGEGGCLSDLVLHTNLSVLCALSGAQTRNLFSLSDRADDGDSSSAVLGRSRQQG
jgi:hypothetical protein